MVEEVHSCSNNITPMSVGYELQVEEHEQSQAYVGFSI